MSKIAVVHNRFAHFTDLGVRVSTCGMMEVSSSLYVDTLARSWQPQWLLVQVLHDPGRTNLDHNTAFETRVYPSNADGDVIGPVLVARPEMTREEILDAYAEISVPNRGGVVWSQRSEEVKS
jgi:hypothetical protein